MIFNLLAKLFGPGVIKNKRLIKSIFIVIAVLIALTVLISAVRDFQTRLYNKGFVAGQIFERNRYELLLRQAAEQNRRREEQLNQKLEQIRANLRKAERLQQQAEQRQTEEIRRFLARQPQLAAPQCEVPQEAVDIRNQVRTME